MDYGFTHAGKVYTPNATPGITPTENDARNREIEAAELAHWQTTPDRMVAYYTIPTSPDGKAIYFGLGAAQQGKRAYVSTWLGTELGLITYATRYRHNFGARMVSLRVRGTNGAEYYGRASWDHRTVIKLRRVR